MTEAAIGLAAERAILTMESSDLEAALNLIKTPHGPERLRVAIRAVGDAGAKKIASMLQRHRHPPIEGSVAAVAAEEPPIKRPVLRRQRLSGCRLAGDKGQ